MENGNVTILIIDDRRSNIIALENLLEKPKRTFISSTSGRDGLKVALANQIDLIILDVQMPELDGFEVAQILKSNNKTKDIPIIFASAEKKERNSIMKGFEEGAVDYLSKPLDPELTKAKVSVLLKIQLQRKELQEKNKALEKADAQIKNNLSQLEAVNKELESFSYSVSHDLRSPLRSIMGYSEILLEDYSKALDDEGKRLLNIIQQNSQRMNQLIEDLLKFSKLGRTQLTKANIDFESMVKKAIEDFNNSTNHRASIEVTTLLPSHADFSLMTQVWLNLISNAVKYSSKKEQPSVYIGSLQQDNETIYFIKDNGSGFDMTYSEKLFNVFQRLHRPTDYEGTGIGLALVQRIVNRHGGKVWAEGKVGHGATFYFSLPSSI